MIVLASDHAGYDLKKRIVKYLNKNNIRFVDIGAEGYEPVDYPDYAFKACEKVLEGRNNKGIFVCGTGVGMALVANKTDGIRAANVYNAKITKIVRAHNNVNVITLAGRDGKVSNFMLKRILKAFLETKYEGGRHKRRLDKIKGIELEN